MANRVVATDVQEIMPTNLSKKEIEPFISVSNLVVTSNLTGKGLSTSVLMEIEKWLTAHLVKTTKERQPSSKKIDTATEKYAAFGMGLRSTTYGQMVLILDTTGTMQKLGLKQASIEAVVSFDDSELLDEE